MKKLKIFSITLLILLLFRSQPSFCQENPGNIKLLPPDLSRGKLLMQALNDRKTGRSFSEKELPLSVISNLFWAAFGINRPDSGLRTAPSAMNLQEIEIFAAKKDGLYIYNAKNNSLDLIIPKDIREKTGIQEFVKEAPLNLIYVADFSKMNFEQKDKEIYAATDAAFISQNVYLFCSSEGLSTVVLGWVDKPKLESAMGLDKNKKVIYTQPVGYPGQ
ncbi:MAG: SagB/ThcOx family dehydrogenase [Candidatus Omnitrophica bacterium]|nr:SagB/ThcOx family dehydrogenase [Candidatus Omnitrophota bacterium]